MHAWVSAVHPQRVEVAINYRVRFGRDEQCARDKDPTDWPRVRTTTCPAWVWRAGAGNRIGEGATEAWGGLNPWDIEQTGGCSWCMSSMAAGNYGVLYCTRSRARPSELRGSHCSAINSGKRRGNRVLFSFIKGST